MTPKTPKTPETQASESAAETPNARAVLIDAPVFEALKQVQKSQTGSPRFDLRGLVSAALRLVLANPNAPQQITQQAGLDFKTNLNQPKSL
jgi:hypothetical protein